jgi:hypothetical protein
MSQRIDAATFNRYASDPAAFRADLLIDADGEPKRFGDVAEPWQVKDFAALDPALRKCNGRVGRDDPTVNRAYLERGRGASKTTDIAVLCAWALAFAVRPLRGYAYAADADQAKLLRDAVAALIRLNPWLSSILTVEATRVVNVAKKHPGEGGVLSIETSDVGSSYGILPDLIVADEIVHWEENAEGLWHSLISSAAKRRDCLMLIISNAGFQESWQWRVREAAKADPAWYWSRLDGPAGWITEARLNEQRRMLPPLAYSRLWENVWSAAGGDALTPEDVDAAFSEEQNRTGPDFRGSGYRLTHGNWQFVAGVDLGVKRDCSAVVVLAVPPHGFRIHLAHHRLWRPPPGGKVDLVGIETHVLGLDERFGLASIGFDPWQAELLSQRLEAVSAHRLRTSRTVNKFALPWARELAPTAANLREQASLTIQGFQDRRFVLYPCPELRRDLLRLRVEERGSGGATWFRLVSPRDGDGHGDLFSAFANALQLAHELTATKPARAGTGGPADPLMPLDRMEGAVWDRAVKTFEERAEAARQRHEYIVNYPAHRDTPLFKYLRATGSPRVI